jgi:hypothetical protein
MLKLTVVLNENGSCTISDPAGHYRTCGSLSQLPETVQLVVIDYAEYLKKRVEEVKNA